MVALTSFRREMAFFASGERSRCDRAALVNGAVFCSVDDQGSVAFKFELVTALNEPSACDRDRTSMKLVIDAVCNGGCQSSSSPW